MEAVSAGGISVAVNLGVCWFSEGLFASQSLELASAGSALAC